MMNDMDRPCADCGVNAGINSGEYYAVTDELWHTYGITPGVLCIGCLEHRMGRELVPADFLPAPCNWWLGRSARFKARAGEPKFYGMRDSIIKDALMVMYGVTA